MVGLDVVQVGGGLLPPSPGLQWSYSIQDGSCLRLVSQMSTYLALRFDFRIAACWSCLNPEPLNVGISNYEFRIEDWQYSRWRQTMLARVAIADDSKFDSARQSQPGIVTVSVRVTTRTTVSA